MTRRIPGLLLILLLGIPAAVASAQDQQDQTEPVAEGPPEPSQLSPPRPVDAFPGWSLVLNDESDVVTKGLEFDPRERTLSRRSVAEGIEIRRPERRSVEDYLRLLVRESIREDQQRRFLEQLRRSPGEDAETMLDDITHIEIPIQFPGPVGSIIGQGANIDVSGSENISFGGETSYLVDEPDYGFGRRSRFPQLDMRQHLTVKLSGTIGEKINVLVDHDSEVQMALENKIRLKYTGHEDEVIQSIEMGNTNLNLRGAQFVGYSGRAEGLFGAKLVGRLGAFDFTTIASKQEGRTSRESYVGSAKEDSIVIRDVEYERRRFYSVWRPDDPHFLNSAIGGIDSLVVWLDDDYGDNDEETGARNGVAYLRIDPGEPVGSDTLHVGKWVRLDEVDDYIVNADIGVIVLRTAVQEGHHLAAAFYSVDAGAWVGNVTADTLRLQMIHPNQDLHSSWIQEGMWYSLRGMELKNVYSLRGQNISRSDYQITIRRATAAEGIQEDNQGGVPFIQIMGLDRGTFTGSVSDPTKPDGIVDPEWIDFDEGLLYFPNYMPFDPDRELYGCDIGGGSSPACYTLDETFPELYQWSEDRIRDHPELQSYIIEAEYRTPTTTYSLGRFGIIRDSEIVTVNGERKTRGVDYQIDYDLGTVRFLTEEASAPDAEISIDYEYAPLLAQAQKTLLGMSGVYQFSDENRVGLTWLYESSTTPELRPRLGQEPTRSLVGDVDFSWQSRPEFLTRWANSLPLVSTQAGSQFRVSGEVATSVPNPNTKNEVYLDDMDGSEEIRSLSVGWRQWRPASPPVPMQLAMTPGYRPNYYSPRDLVRERDLFTGLSGNEGDAYRTVLELRPHPDEVDQGPEAWVGIMRLLSGDGANLSEQKFIEVWIDTGPVAERQGVMHIDLGDIDEDFYEPDLDVLDDEDGSGGGIRDGELEFDTEDIGLDAVKGEDGTGVEGDAGNDDYDYDYDHDRYNYLRINGTENNRYRDTEDLDKDGILNTKNGYFTVEVDLANAIPAEDNFLAIDNAGQDGTGESTWRLYRVPLSEFEEQLPRDKVPTWTGIRYARLWFTGMEPGTGQWVRIGSIEIVGNAWLEDGLRTAQYSDTLGGAQGAEEEVTVQVRNNKEHSAFYDPPFDVEEVQTPQGEVERREQSLALVYESLEPGHMGSAHKSVVQSADPSLNDYSEYRSLSFFVRSYKSEPADRPPTFYVRLGADSANFYEYRLLMDGGDEWQSVDVPLEDLPRRKLDSPDTIITYNHAVNIEVRDDGWGVPTGTGPVSREVVAVYGKPSLTRVLYLATGVRNEWGEEITGELWLDELRLRDVRREVGIAGRLAASASLADVASANLTYTRKDSEFRTLGGNRSGNDDNALSVGGRLNLHKFFEQTGFALPLSATYNSRRRVPRLLTGSDIVLDEALKFRERSVSDDYNASLTLTHPTTSKSVWGRMFLDGFQAGASMARSNASSPEIESRRREERGSVQYSLAPPFEPNLRIWREFRIGYLPDVVSLRANGSRIKDLSYDVEPGRIRGKAKVDRVTRSVEGFMSVRYTPLQGESMSSEYSFEMYRDLDRDKNVPLVRSLGWGVETRRRQTVSWRYQPSLFSLLTPLLTYQGSYDENQSPQIRRTGDPEGVRNITNSGELRASTTVSAKGFLRRVSGWWEKRQEHKRREREEEARERAAADTTETGMEGEEAGATVEEAPAEGAPEEKEEKTGPGILERLARGAGKLQDFNFNWSRRQNSSYQRTTERPPLSYQFGLVLEAPGEAGAGLIGQSSSSRTRSRTLTVKGGARPVGGLSVDFSYSGSQSTQESASNASERSSVTWPEVTLSLSSLEKLGFWDRFLQRATLNSSLRRRVEESGRRGIVDERQETFALSPLFQFSSTWNSGLQLTVTGNHTRTRSEDRRNNFRVNRSVSSNLAVGARYSLRLDTGGDDEGRSRRRSSQSEIKLSADLRLGRDKSERKIGVDGNWEEDGRSNSLSLEPQASYTFTQNITGSARAHFIQDTDQKRGETRRRIGIFVSLNIRF